MARQCQPGNPTGRNPGVTLGAIVGEAALHGRDKVTLLADDLWRPLGPWLEQLVAESSGKQGKGILPIESEPQQAPEQYSADRLFVYLRSDGGLDDFCSRLRNAGHPVISLAPVDAGDLGAEFYRWEIAVAVACSIIGVNSFDQPDVQDNKDRTAKKVKEYQQTKKLDEGKPFWENPQARVFGQEIAVEDSKDVSVVVREFLKQSKEGDFVAINAYLPRNPQNTANLQELRRCVQELTGRPTTLGFGPRFLHSTGQLHKGGANNGLFLQITEDPGEDLQIPGLGLSFGTMERAQALGDLEALLARKRRAIRIHLLKAKVPDLLAS
jgi:transaldolase/glucose-6-phosphate isomerase